jgi:potassium large conductance calcium-activated channel subfamily M alpha protein 1
MHAKLEVFGIATMLKIMFAKSNEELRQSMSRNELVSFINLFAKLSKSVNNVKMVNNMIKKAHKEFKIKKYRCILLVGIFGIFMTLIILNFANIDEEEIKNNNNNILDKKLNSSGLGDIFEIINCSITFIIIIFYIISTYTYPPLSSTYNKINNTIENIELYLITFLILHFILKFYVSQQRLLFILELTSLVDISTIIMIVLSNTKFISYKAKYFFRLFRMIRIIYLFKLENLLQKKTNETVRYLFKLVIAFISLVFLSASSILEIENYYFRLEYGDYSVDSSLVELNGKGTSSLMRFHDVVYFELVTLTTIGYGDITPKYWISRYIIILTVVALLVIVLPLYSKLKVIFTLNTKYSRMTYQKSSKKLKHVLVLGECGIESYEAFLEELYNADHGQTNYDTIIMQSNQDKEIMKLIKGLSFGQKIFYLVGNSLLQKDLERCRADSSICAVILANRLAKNPRLEDFSNIMKAFSIRKFKHIFSKEKDARICIQLLRPETKEIYYSSLISDNEVHSANTQIICVEEIKLQLLGKSCLCPGITTIIASLITSKKPSEYENEHFSKKYEWLKEYLYGIQQEIYFVSLKAELMHNLKFIDIVKLVYKVSGLVVIGIDVIIDDLKPFVCLNPSNYLISPFDTLVYILADSQPDSEELNNLIRNYLENNSKGIVEKNREMVKLLRLKSFYWNKIANIPDYFHNPEMQATLGIKLSNENYVNNNNKYSSYNSHELYKESIKKIYRKNL